MVSVTLPAGRGYANERTSSSGVIPPWETRRRGPRHAGRPAGRATSVTFRRPCRTTCDAGRRLYVDRRLAVESLLGRIDVEGETVMEGTREPRQSPVFPRRRDLVERRRRRRGDRRGRGGRERRVRDRSSRALGRARSKEDEDGGDGGTAEHGARNAGGHERRGQGGGPAISGALQHSGPRSSANGRVPNVARALEMSGGRAGIGRRAAPRVGRRARGEPVRTDAGARTWRLRSERRGS